MAVAATSLGELSGDPEMAVWSQPPGQTWVNKGIRLSYDGKSFKKYAIPFFPPSASVSLDNLCTAFSPYRCMNVQNFNTVGQSSLSALPRPSYLAAEPPPPDEAITRSDQPPNIDPFADEGQQLSNEEVGTQQNYIHIRIQQRNGRKTLTTLQGLPKGELAFEPPQPRSAI